MVVISNSSPVIHLAKINKLNLLEKLYTKVIVPEKVYLECTETTQYHQEIQLISNSTWMTTLHIKDIRLFNLLYTEIDAGEAESLVLALEKDADLVLLDDMEARIKARSLGLNVTGTLGVLLKANNQGLITSLYEEINKLEQTGFWISSDLKDKVLSFE